MGAEPAEVSKAVDGFCPPVSDLLEERGQRERVVVDAAENGDARQRPFARRLISCRGQESLPGGLSLVGAQSVTGARRGLAKLRERHEPLSPGCKAAMGGQPGALFGPSRSEFLVLGWSTCHAQISRVK